MFHCKGGGGSGHLCLMYQGGALVSDGVAIVKWTKNKMLAKQLLGNCLGFIYNSFFT